MEHYFSQKPSVLSERSEYETSVRGRRFRFTTDRQVFSREGLDRGTRVLLESILDHQIIPQFFRSESVRFLDLAAGYGPIGIILGHFYPQLQVTFSEINERALALCELNAKDSFSKGSAHARSGASGGSLATFVAADGFDGLKDEHFDIITLNPPMRTGKRQVQNLLKAALEHLNESGILITVIGKKQGADSYAKFLNEMGRSERLNLDKGFEVRVTWRKTEASR